MKKKRRNSKKDSDGISLIIVLALSAYLSSIIDYIIIIFVVIFVLILIIVLLYFISRKISEHKVYDTNKFEGNFENQDIPKTTTQKQKTLKNKKQANYTDIEMFARECNAILHKEDMQEWYNTPTTVSNESDENLLDQHVITEESTDTNENYDSISTLSSENDYADSPMIKEAPKTTIQKQKILKNRKRAKYTDIEIFARECNAILHKEDMQEWYNTSTASNESWRDIEEVEPDEIDLQMLSEIENNPECKEFVSSEDAMNELGL